MDRHARTAMLIMGVKTTRRLTSPSHLFLPLRQLVQARAPRLGMWADPPPPGVGGAASPDADSLGEPISDRAGPLGAGPPAPAAKLAVRRRLPLGCS